MSFVFSFIIYLIEIETAKVLGSIILAIWKQWTIIFNTSFPIPTKNANVLIYARTFECTEYIGKIVKLNAFSNSEQLRPL